MNGISHRDTTAFVLPCVLLAVTECNQRSFGAGDMDLRRTRRSTKTPDPFFVPRSYEHRASTFSLEGGLDGLRRNFFHPPTHRTPRRAINPGEGLLRPRGVRAQTIIRSSSHPSDRVASASKKAMVWLFPSHPSELARYTLQGRPGRSSNARVERAHSDRVRSASRRTTRPPVPLPRAITPYSTF